MFRRVTSVIAIVALLAQTIGCAVHSSRRLSGSDLLSAGTTTTIKSIVLVDGTEVEFGAGGAMYFPSTQTISGYPKGHEPRTFWKNRERGVAEEGEMAVYSVDDVLYARVETVNVGASIAATLGITLLVMAAIIGVAIATKESCPFVYAWDGERFVFDAEPLGGSVSRGLERADLSRLEHLKPLQNEYRLRVRNEVPEIQYLDDMKLVVVDHAPGRHIVSDLTGTLYAVEDATAPASAVDENGRDLLPFFRATDGVAWQTKLPKDDTWKGAPRRHEITLRFDKPAGANEARMVVNAGTALWGSNMIREMLQMRGDGVGRWHESIDRGGPAMEELTRFNEREELYFLKFYVRRHGEWTFGGWIPGGGPFITEDRVIPIDLSGVDGDAVEIRMMPPKGFWTFDYMAVEFGAGETVTGTPVPLRKATTSEGTDILGLLAARDGRRYVMREMGDDAALVFDAPAPVAGMERTVFLETFGYYEIQIDETQPEKTALIERMLATPGAIVDYALDEYVRWSTSQMSRN